MRPQTLRPALIHNSHEDTTCNGPFPTNFPPSRAAPPRCSPRSRHPSFASTSGVVISQVYGGNGNTVASDYVELFNAGPAR